eukprot:4938698-Amphidinium_carterae.1
MSKTLYTNGLSSLLSDFINVLCRCDVRGKLPFRAVCSSIGMEEEPRDEIWNFVPIESPLRPEPRKHATS